MDQLIFAWIGYAVGGALAFGALGRAQHWAVRVLCVVGTLLAAVGMVVALLIGGKSSVVADVLFRVMLGVVIVGAVQVVLRLADGACWVMAGGRRRAAWVAGCAAVALAVGIVAARADFAGVPAVAAVAAESSVLAVPAGVVEPVASESQTQDCPCGTGAVCTGPRGGPYCIADGGGKRYLASAK